MKIVMAASSHPERDMHGRTEVFFEPPNRPKQDTKPLRERKLNKKVMDLKQTGGIVNIKGGQMQFGRHREGNACHGGITQDKGDLEWSDKPVQTSLPSAELALDAPAPLAAAEFNSTLRLAGRIRRLERHEPDLSRLAEERLRRHPAEARQMRNKTYERLNFGPDEYQYGDLVPVEVDESLLIRQVEARKQARVDACRPDSNPPPAGPHVRDLLHLAVQHEFPVPPTAEELTARPPPPRAVGYDELARRATERHRRVFTGQR